MEYLESFGDRRTLMSCAFCGGQTGTRDHCPSQVFLDIPYPEQLPVVPACPTCNTSFSLDEEYLACLISCVIAGSADLDSIPRERIKNILARKPALLAKIEHSRSVSDERTVFTPEHGRVSTVITKLAQGHVLYELHELAARPPDSIEYSPLSIMTPSQRSTFENAEIVSEVWPEVGSRAMQRMTEGTDVGPRGWITVQPRRYRYRTFLGDGIEARIVIQEYLGCRVHWER